MTSASQRQDLLDLLYNVLNEPEKFGDKFLVEIVNRSKDGMIAVSSLQNMALVLNEYPKAYFIHCIPLDEKQRFRQSCDGSKVGLVSHPCNVETDEFGFIKYDDDPVTTVRNSVRQSIMSQLNNLDELSPKRNSVMPVVYSNGKFYIDGEPNKTPNMNEDLDFQEFKYDKVDIKPIGLRGEIDHFEYISPHCYNCGSRDHKLIDCKLPIDKLKVAKNRKKRNGDIGHTSRRLYLELDLQDKISKIAPGVLSETLKEALGMRSDEEEPPYYRNMRAIGYPPGYIGKEGYQIPYGSKMTLDDVINTKAPLLKVYRDDGTDYESEDEKEEISSGISKPQNVKLVYYPGLNLIDTSELDQYRVSQSNARTTSNRENVQNHWEQYYLQQGQYYPPQQVYPLEQQQIYPPGTQVQNNYYNPPNSIPATSMFNPSSSPFETEIIPTVENESDDDMDISSDDGN